MKLLFSIQGKILNENHNLPAWAIQLTFISFILVYLQGYGGGVMGLMSGGCRDALISVIAMKI